MRKVWRETLSADVGMSARELPTGARVVHVGPGRNLKLVDIWYEWWEDENMSIEGRYFVVVGTGVDIRYTDATHLGTAIHELGDARAVWHVYEVRPEEA